MFARVMTNILTRFFYQPVDVLISLVFACAVSIVASTGVLVRRRRAGRTLTMKGLAPALVLLAFSLGDWALLRALPVLKLSFSTDIRAPLLASLVVRLVVLWALLAASLVVQWRARHQGVKRNTTRRKELVSPQRRHPSLVGTLRRGRKAAARSFLQRSSSTKSILILFLGINLAFSLVQLDAYVLEPLWTRTTRVSLLFSDLDPDMPPVRMVQLGDIHTERNSYREAQVIRKVNALEPDVIVLTGDYINLSRLDDPVSVEHFRDFVSQLHAPYGIYAVRGSVERTPESMARLVEGTDITWLEQETHTINVRGQEITLVGVACSHRQETDVARLDRAMDHVSPDAFTVLLYHSPDLIAEASDRGIDLYLGGHTHGGQLRLPFFGAIVTGSAYGKQYERGLFQYDDTTMYITQGIGFEGGGMPRARFLCRPEIVSLELAPYQPYSAES